MTRSVVGRKAMGTDLNAPVAGAYMPITVYFERTGALVTDTVVVRLDSVLPPGMKVRILGTSLTANVLSAGTVAVDVGDGTDVNSYIVNQALAAAGSSYQKCNGVAAANVAVGDAEFDTTAVAPANELRVTVTLTGATFDSIAVILWLIPTSQDTDIAVRA